jgi:hypothetical protein
MEGTMKNIKVSLIIAALSISAIGFSQAKAPAKKPTDKPAAKKMACKMECCKKGKVGCDKCAKCMKMKKSAPKKGK